MKGETKIESKLSLKYALIAQLAQVYVLEVYFVCR